MPCNTTQRNRIYFANQQVGLKSDCDIQTVGPVFDVDDVLHGVQSVGITNDFANEQAFELCQASIYENVEGLPEIQISLDKVLDGYPLLYHMATLDATNPTLPGRSAAKAGFALSVFDDTLQSACDAPVATMFSSGAYINSVSYAFGVDGFFTESITMLSDNKIWTLPAGVDTLPAYQTGCTSCSGLSPGFTSLASLISFSGFCCDNNDSPLVNVQSKEHMLFDFDGSLGLDTNCQVADADATILPPDVFGITASGTQENDEVCVQNINVSVDFNRESFNCLGKRGVAFRAVSFPVEVTSDIEVIGHGGDMVSALEDGVCISAGGCAVGHNLINRSIRIATCEGTRIYLGSKNKLSSINYGGGDAGGGNVTITYSYTTFNDFTVIHEQDPTASGAVGLGDGDWWGNRADYLVDP